MLLRRLVEEAVLAGIPSILLDSNNDLVRMADAWPTPPEGVTDDDRRRAERYAALAEVVVWTPGRTRGNPLVLPPLPDFEAVRDDEDEREAAVGMAAAALEPLVIGGGAAASQQRGVLMDALRQLARTGDASLDALVALLRDLPPETSRNSQAQKHATRLADELLAAQSRNPLLAQAGTPLDPARLLGGTPGRVRVSVVNLAGLPDEPTRRDFVGRLLMALFSHVRRHPATEARPVGSLLVMDEAHHFASAVQASPSREAALSLVRQARKYGLGMVFATQAPRDIHNGIVNNCTTKLIGRCSAPATIEAARDILAASGGSGDDIARLEQGVFYLMTEGFDRPLRLRAPLCLTHHPANPPAEEEVVERAARCRLLVG